MPSSQISIDMGKALKLTRNKAKAGMARACMYVVGKIKLRFQPGTGRVYKVHGKIHKASAPGESPAVLNGFLRASITSEVKVSEREVTGYVGSKLKYARRMELGFVGTDSAGRTYDQAPRPYLRPAINDNKAGTVQAFREGARNAP